MLILWSLALAQLRHHAGRWALLAAGIALVVAVPVVTAGVTAAVSAQTIRRTISGFDLTDHTLLVVQEADSVLRKGSPDANDVVVRAQLARLSATPALHEMLFRPLTVNGPTFQLGAVDHLSGAVHLVSGRLPRSCTPTRCEVVVVGSANPPGLRAALATLGAVLVGRVQRTDPLLASGALAIPNTPVVLGSNVDELFALKTLELFDRHYAWVAPIDADRVVALGVDGYVARSADVQATLTDRIGAVTFARPDEALQEAQSRADVSQQRFGLLGGFAAVLLLGFAVVAAIGLRRESRQLTTLLARRGATSAQVVTVTVLEAVLVTVVGAVVGGAVGAAVAGAVSHGTGHGALAAAGRALGSAAPSAALLALGTAAVTVAVLLWADAQARAVWRLLDVITLACLGAALLAADRGSTSTSRLASSGDPLVVALPVLTSVIAGLVAARLWGPAARLAERLVPRRSLAARVGLLGAIRRPLRPVATVAFLTAAVVAVVFAGAYRATLLANDADQAAYQVPLDATVAASPSVLVPYVAPDAFGQHGQVFPVQRASAGITRFAGVTDSVPLLALDASALPLLHDWRRVSGSSMSAAELAGKLRLSSPVRRPALPAGARAISILASGINSSTVMTVWVRNDAGREFAVTLARRGDRLVGALPRTSGVTQAVAFGIDETTEYASRRAHGLGEGNSDLPALSGRLQLGAVSIDGSPVRWDWSSWGSLQSTARASADQLVLDYKIRAAPVIAAPDAAAMQSAQIPVAVDAQTAQDAHGGVLQLAIDSSTTLDARVVATLPRLPTVGSSFVLVDRGAYTQALDVREPGSSATEFWIRAPSSALDRTLATPQFRELTVTRRDTVQAALDSDPIGRGARTLLMVVALLALAVGAVSLVLIVIGERRDGAGELYAWEADGVRPRTLRRVVLVRMLAVAAVAVPVGVAAGLILARVGATLVAVDASGDTPTPPLAVTLGSVWTPLALVVGIGAGLLLGWLVCALSLRERFPVAADSDLR